MVKESLHSLNHSQGSVAYGDGECFVDAVWRGIVVVDVSENLTSARQDEYGGEGEHRADPERHVDVGFAELAGYPRSSGAADESNEAVSSRGGSTAPRELRS